MQVVLYVVVILAGMIIPFFIKNDNSWKEKSLYYLVVLADMGILFIASIMGYISVPTHGMKESIIVGIMAIALGCILAKVCRKINYKSPRKTQQNNETAA